MCFTTLPPELQEEIIIDLEKPDLYSLCLVSKSLLHLARPLLYRSVELHLDSWQRAQEDVARDMWMSCDGEEDAVEFMDKAKADFEGREYHRNKLIKTFEAHQDWKKFVQKVTIDFNVSAEGSSQASQLGRLLSSCPNLRTLAINSAYHNATGSFLLQHTPPSLRSLDFEYSQLPAEFILRLLNKLPLVEILSLADDKTEGLFPLVPNQSIPRLDRLRSLTLSHPFRGPSFFSAITSSTNSLSTLSADFIAVQALLPKRLSTLTTLSIFGRFEPSYTRYGDYPKDLASNLIRVFKGCQSLRYLKIAFTDPYGRSSVVSTFQTSKILHHLPQTLQTLVLKSLDFSKEYLLDFLSSSHKRLSQFDCSRLSEGGDDLLELLGPTSFDEEGEDKIEEICEARGIRLSWIGGRVKGQCDRGLSLSGLHRM